MLRVLSGGGRLCGVAKHPLVLEFSHFQLRLRRSLVPCQPVYMCVCPRHTKGKVAGAVLFCWYRASEKVAGTGSSHTFLHCVLNFKPPPPPHLMSNFKLPSEALWTWLGVGWALCVCVLVFALEVHASAHLGLYKAAGMRGPWPLHPFAVFAFVIDFSWKTLSQ